MKEDSINSIYKQMKEDAINSIYKLKESVTKHKDLSYHDGLFDAIEAIQDLPFNYLEQINDRPKLGDTYDEVYKRGLRDAWECAKKIAMYEVDIYEVYGTAIKKHVWNMNPSEAIAKLQEYEAKQSEIKVGDIVKYNEKNGIVTFIKGNLMYIMWKDGSAGEFLDAEKWIKRTGRHLDIDSIFEWLKGVDDVK